MQKAPFSLIFSFLLVLLLLFVSVSCGADDDDDVQEAGKAYLSLSLTSSDENLSRALSENPSARDIVPEEELPSLTNLTLKGTYASSGIEETLAAEDSLLALKNALATKELPIGVWTFALTVEINGILYSGTSEPITLKAGSNSISILLEEPTSDTYYGGFSLTISYSGNASRVTAMVTSIDGTATICGEEDLSLAESGKVTYAKARDNDSEKIASGRYLVTVIFYGGDDQSLLLNTYREYVRIVPGRTSLASRELDLNEVFTMSYYDVGTDGSASIIDGSTVTFSTSAPTQFSRRSAFTLPLASKTGCQFLGWYTDAACTAGNEITEVTRGRAENLSVYAKWKKVRYAAITDGAGVTTSYSDLLSTVTAITNASGDITLTLYEDVTAADISQSSTSGKIANAIKSTGADSISLVIDEDAGIVCASSTSSVFMNCTKLISADLRGLDTSNVTNMSGTFSMCTKLKSVDLRGLDTSHVTGMSSLFYNCSSLTELDLTMLNTASVTSMTRMFSGCSGLTSLDLHGLDTSNVTSMSNMFYNCSGLTSLDVSGFDTSAVTDMGSMFNGCSGLTSLDVSGFDTSAVTKMGSMFNGCSGLTSLDVSGFDTSAVTDMGSMFSGCSGLTSLDVSGFDTSAVTDMGIMFYKCSGLTSLDMSGFDTSAVTGMGSMFSGCSGLTSLDVSGFDTSAVRYMGGMFNACSSLTAIYASTSFVTTAVTLSSGMFASCTSLVGGAGTPFSSSFTDATYARIDGGTASPGYFTGTVYAKVNDTWYENLADTVNAITNASGDITVTLYGAVQEGDIGKSATSGTIAYAIAHTSASAVSLVADDSAGIALTMASNMFKDCTKLVSARLSGFDTRHLSSAFGMFSGCTSLTSLDISGFDTQELSTTDEMFYGCSLLETITVSGLFVTTSVTTSDDMFTGCTSLAGGAGTVYDAGHTDAEYACSDGGTARPGYFTGKTVVYVSSSGNDTTGDGTKASPYASLSRSETHINAAAQSDAEWVVCLSGGFAGTQTIGTVDAKSLILAGVNYNTGTGGAKDGFYGNNKTASSLVLNTNVPVMLSGLYVSGGSVGVEVTGTGTVTFAKSGTNSNGQGMKITGNANVIIESSWVGDNSASVDGGGIYKAGSGTLILRNSTVGSNTTTKNGGGIYLAQGFAELTESSYVGTDSSPNSAASGGGIYVAAGTSLTIEDLCGIAGNTASADGGGVYCGGVLDFRGGSIGGSGASHANTAVNGGGVYLVSAASLIMDGSAEIAYNTATNGGGVYVGSGASLTMENLSAVMHNTATANGGGINNSGIVTMSGGTVSGNTGGGMYNTASGTIFMYGSAVVGDSSKTETASESAYANKGSGITSQGTVYLGYSDSGTKVPLTGGIYYNGDCGIGLLNGTLFMDSGNISYNWGRGVYVGSDDYNKYGTFTMTGGTIQGNACDGPGGGVYCGYHGRFTMNGGTVSGNTATNGGGVAIANSLSSFTMTDGTISGNTATGNGGGVYIAANTFTMSGGTISSNASGSYGGGIYNSGTFNMTGGTISGNTAVTSGGGLAVWSTVTLGGDASIPAGTDGKNDVFLYTDAGTKWTLALSSPLTRSQTIRLTPGDYTAGRSMLTLASGATTTVAAEYTKFAVTPKGSETWSIDSAGLLQQQVTGGISISMPTYTSDDLELTAALSGENYVFTAKDGYSTYIWAIDGTTQGSTANTCSIARSTFTMGTHIMLLIAIDSGGNYHNATTTITVE